MGVSVKKTWQTMEPRLALHYEAENKFFTIPGTVYTWRVAARNAAGGQGDWSAERKFVFSRPDPTRPPTDTPKPPDTPVSTVPPKTTP
jgi:hypothetical protein